MSWSDDTRCLHCDGKLPLYRKITSGQFCSAMHRKAYWQEQERLAVERLHQTHDSLHAYRPLGTLEPAPLRAPAREPDIPLNTFEDVTEGPTVEERARSASNKGQVKFAGFITSKPDPRAEKEASAGGDLELATLPGGVFALPSLRAGLVARAWEAAPGTPIPFFHAAALGPASRPAVMGTGPDRLLPGSLARGTSWRIPFVAMPETPELDPPLAVDAPTSETAIAEPELVAPVPARMLALARIGLRSGVTAPRIPAQELVHAAARPLQTISARMTGGDGCLVMAAAASLMPLTLRPTPPRQDAQLPAAREPQALDLGLTPGAPPVEMDLPALAPGLRLAPGSRYRMSAGLGAGTRGGKTNPAESPRLLALNVAAPQLVRQPELEPGLAAERHYLVSFRPRQLEPAAVRPAVPQAMDAGTKMAIPGLPRGLGASSPAPVVPSLQPLAFRAQPRMPRAAQPVVSNLVHAYPDHPPLQPAAKWTPIEGAFEPRPRTGFLPGWPGAMNPFGADNDERKHVWLHAADFWRNAPRDLKLLAFAIPVLLGLALRPSLPKLRVAAPAVGVAVPGSVERGFEERLQVVRRSVADRAGVALNDDFRAGLDDWQSRGDLSAAWSFDRNGFVKPGTLALYRPSMNLSDYQMEFLGLIDKKAMSWVVRAADFDNYYVIKLVVLKPGPMPTLGITRYAVIHGKAQNRVDNIAAINARTDMLYRVNLNVQDDTFLLTLQGKVVDTWSEPRLRSGGIGFFSQQGEESRLRWVQVTHQYDMLGRLCAYLAPYDIPTTNGSW